MDVLLLSILTSMDVFSCDSCCNYMFYLQILNLKPAAVTRKRDTKYAVALDSENNSIQVKDVIKVIDGPHSVNTFTMYIWNSVPWFINRVISFIILLVGIFCSEYAFLISESLAFLIILVGFFLTIGSPRWDQTSVQELLFSDVQDNDRKWWLLCV